MNHEQIPTEAERRRAHDHPQPTRSPQRVDRHDARELIAAIDPADADDEVRAIIVTGAGRGFCAGADLAGGGATFDWRERERRDGRRSPETTAGRFTLRVFECRKPVIAAINGPAVGVGATMTLPMDIRLAADDARIGFVFARRGIVPEACSSWFLPRLVGISRAMEWVATGRVFSAQEALEGGLVRSVHPADELLDAASGSPRRSLTRPPRSASPWPASCCGDARRRASDARPPRRLTRDVRCAGSPPTPPRGSPRSSRSARPSSRTGSARGSRTSCPGGAAPEFR